MVVLSKGGQPMAASGKSPLPKRTGAKRSSKNPAAGGRAPPRPGPSGATLPVTDSRSEVLIPPSDLAARGQTVRAPSRKAQANRRKSGLTARGRPAEARAHLDRPGVDVSDVFRGMAARNKPMTDLLEHCVDGGVLVHTPSDTAGSVPIAAHPTKTAARSKTTRAFFSTHHRSTTEFVGNTFRLAGDRIDFFGSRQKGTVPSTTGHAHPSQCLPTFG